MHPKDSGRYKLKKKHGVSTLVVKQKGEKPRHKMKPMKHAIVKLAGWHHSVFKNSMDAILFTVSDGRILAANPEACRMFGRTEQELRKVGRNGVVDAEDPRLQAALEERDRTGKFKGELTFKRGDGTKFPGEITTTIFKDRNGLERSSMVIHDITDRKRIEEALRERDNLLTNISSQIPGMIYTFLRRPDGTYCVPFTSEAIRDIFGCSPQDVREDFSPIAKAILPEDFDKVVSSIEYSANHLTLWHCEYRVRIAGQPIRWMWGQSQPFKLSDGSIIWYGFNADVTERKNMEDELRKHTEHLEELVLERAKELHESEARYRAVVESQTELVVRLQPDWTFTFVNDAYCRFVGKKREELIGADAAQFVLEEDVQKAKSVHSTFSLENPVVSYQERDLAAGGEIRWTEWTDRGIFDEQGNLVEIQSVARDITERRQMEQALRKAERFSAIGEAAAMVGHDLRNPLQVIVNRLYLAKRAVESLSSPYSEVAEKLGLEELFAELGYQTSYMNKIVSNLQDYAMPITPEPVSTNISRLLDETFSTIQVPANVEVSTEIDKDFPELMMDRELMRRALANLITNAIQAMPDGGQLTVRASKTKDDVLISIRDTGEGMSEENLDRLFDPLFTTKAKGTGLGLPVSKRLVEANNGTITIESQLGKGSTFTVKLPITKR